MAALAIKHFHASVVVVEYNNGTRAVELQVRASNESGETITVPIFGEVPDNEWNYHDTFEKSIEAAAQKGIDYLNGCITKENKA